jgi:hypothetical protein
MAENDEVIFSICHIWPRDVIDDVYKGRAEAVVRDSSERRLVAVLCSHHF